jgi:chromosome segregation ATPase
VKIKDKSKAILEQSRKMVFNSEPELKADYEAIHQARNDYDATLKEAEERGTVPPPTEGVELRTTNELHAELETQEANLEMNLNTNPGVVEQYEKRKKEVCVACKYLSTWH